MSAHFLVRRDGELLQFVSCDARAWHAGASTWRGRSDCNDFSIGIELEGLEGERFEAAQYAPSRLLVESLMRRYPIGGVAGHEHVAPGRKRDPGAGFDWRRLRRLLGLPASVFSRGRDRAALSACGGNAQAGCRRGAGSRVKFGVAPSVARVRRNEMPSASRLHGERAVRGLSGSIRAQRPTRYT